MTLVIQWVSPCGPTSFAKSMRWPLHLPAWRAIVHPYIPVEITGTSQLCYSPRKVKTISWSVKMLEGSEVGWLEKTGSLSIKVQDENHQMCDRASTPRNVCPQRHSILDPFLAQVTNEQMLPLSSLFTEVCPLLRCCLSEMHFFKIHFWPCWYAWTHWLSKHIFLHDFSPSVKLDWNSKLIGLGKG